jgi:hypothetical protein
MPYLLSHRTRISSQLAAARAAAEADAGANGAGGASASSSSALTKELQRSASVASLQLLATVVDTALVGGGWAPGACVWGVLGGGGHLAPRARQPSAAAG